MSMTDLSMWKDQDWAEYITKRSSEVEIDDSTTDHYSGTPTASELAKYIDHTQLKPDATEQQIDQLCNEAKDEAKTAFDNGATELDMVIPIGLLKSQRYAAVFNDIFSVVQTKSKYEPPHQANSQIVKVIIETGLLTRSEIIAACIIAQAAGADFVKTCTGFSGGKATPEDVRLMKKTVERLSSGDFPSSAVARVKASAGIRSYAATLALIEAGADRIGASAGVAIMSEAAGQSVGVATNSGY
ncbi:MAG: hypothetical protein MMC33_005419 [Icmadophila ericetorum]|nr:hypothetical protein [Icmadophila ericetorum]